MYARMENRTNAKRMEDEKKKILLNKKQIAHNVAAAATNEDRNFTRTRINVFETIADQ